MVHLSDVEWLEPFQEKTEVLEFAWWTVLFTSRMCTCSVPFPEGHMCLSFLCLDNSFCSPVKVNYQCDPSAQLSLPENHLTPLTRWDAFVTGAHCTLFVLITLVTVGNFTLVLCDELMKSLPLNDWLHTVGTVSYLVTTVSLHLDHWLAYSRHSVNACVNECIMGSSGR